MKKYSGLGLLFALCLSTGLVQAGTPQPPPKKIDSFGNTAPTNFSMANATEGEACAVEGARTRTAEHMAVVCKMKDGAKVWQVVGLYNVEKVFGYDFVGGRSAPMVLWAKASCPAGKKVVSGGCQYKGSSERYFDVSAATDNDKTWECSLLVEKFFQLSAADGVVSTAICADWQEY